ncbi:hypothetical protein ElyMa_005551200 [Elysia marginata]|uniref:Uncharacterized protein n=1 Tax=Elysia marginata TaxID=1093978 RepID=A0AAV4F0D0_9GAST|nr:hypothetical protein ElyMa_005551200 [Elysia marginata]
MIESTANLHETRVGQADRSTIILCCKEDFSREQLSYSDQTLDVMWDKYKVIILRIKVTKKMTIKSRGCNEYDDNYHNDGHDDDNDDDDDDDYDDDDDDDDDDDEHTAAFTTTNITTLKK